jgi:DNA adenine methylase
LGGGAVFFHFQPWPASLMDINADLINTYQQVRDNVEEVIVRLSRLEICRNVYDEMRSKSTGDPLTRAVRFLYLNRTAFNGIYRVNRRGEFNVPFGCKPGTVLCDEALLQNASRALKNRRLGVCDFEETIDQAAPGDLIYADPPYTTKHNNNSFRRYNEVLFSWSHQERLAECLHRAARRKVQVILSSADHGSLIDLYNGFSVKQVARRSLISGVVKGRGEITETLIYKLHD